MVCPPARGLVFPCLPTCVPVLYGVRLHKVLSTLVCHCLPPLCCVFEVLPPLVSHCLPTCVGAHNEASKQPRKLASKQASKPARQAGSQAGQASNQASRQAGRQPASQPACLQPASRASEVVHRAGFQYRQRTTGQRHAGFLPWQCIVQGKCERAVLCGMLPVGLNGHVATEDVSCLGVALECGPRGL